MVSNQVLSKDFDTAKWIKENAIKKVILAGVDTNGFLKGKFVPATQFLQMVESDTGLHICDVFFVIDPTEEQLVEPPDGHPFYFPTRLKGYPDILLKPDISTLRIVPWLENTAIVVCDILLPDGEPIPISPRQILKRVIDRAKKMGYEPCIAFEYEFYLVPETAQSLKEKHFVDVQSWRARPYTYDIYGGVLDEDIIGLLHEYMSLFGVKTEAYHTETGPGQYELNLPYEEALNAADNAILYKTGTKQFAARNGYIATFMAKPQTSWPGNSCHAHVSLWKEGQNVFWSGESSMESDILHHYSGGLLKTMKEFTAMFAPTVNSYKRFVPYSWAATTVSWGLDNRSTGLRLILEGSKKTRLEQRQGGGDANPYLLAAALIAGGLYGIENSIEPPPLFDGDAYVSSELDMLPTSLDEAIKLFSSSEVAKEYFGEDFVHYYTILKQHEINDYNLSVTDWEVKRYFELF